MIHQLTPSCLAVKVPEDAKDPWMLERPDPQLAYYLPNKSFGEEGNMWSESIKLPPGNWKILGRGKNLTEGQWRGIVETVDYDVPPSPSNDFQGDWRTAYRDYDSDVETGYSEYPFVRTATESGLSLLKAHNLEPDVLILTKQP